ncbi:hypothetical protein GCM10009754_61540 [Amycolatopsis minnesotensis]|uniref:Uncharacterized protein n=1 Tax=Amycolatopsis minnesotensis TaxID=337894 RepID=A0ABN2RYT2_9PSEU
MLPALLIATSSRPYRRTAFVDEPLHLLGHAQARRVATRLPDLGLHLPPQLDAPPAERDFRALGGEQLRGGTAYPGGRARDQHDLAPEPAGGGAGRGQPGRRGAEVGRQDPLRSWTWERGAGTGAGKSVMMTRLRARGPV